MTLLLESLATDPFPPLQEPRPRMRASDAEREASCGRCSTPWPAGS